MTGRDADMMGRRIALHLRKNNFAVCLEILESAKEEAQDGNMVVEAIAELDCLGLREINLLEKAGYIYLSDFDGVNLDTLHFYVEHLGMLGRDRVRFAVERARTHNCVIEERAVEKQLSEEHKAEL